MTDVDAEKIKNNILEQLAWDNSVDESKIRIEVTDGVVNLEGIATSYSEKISAAKDAFQVRGVRQVNNNLEVRFTGETELPGDEQITDNVIRSLQWNSEIKAGDIIVETQDRVVTLKGRVPTFWEKRKAQDLADQTKGVTGVVNLIDVKLTKTVTDLDIENDIKKAYERSLLIDHDRITVKVHSGVVRLTGSVSNLLIKNESLNLAEYTKGVINVTDEISVE